MRFNIVVPGRLFEEVASTLRDGLCALGHEAKRLNYIDNSGQHTNIILGAHLLPRHVVASIGDAPVIVYNLEQVESFFFPTASREVFEKYPVWDYSTRNVAAWAKRGITAKHVPLGYVSGMTRIPPAKQDIDVLFYGIVNERRMKIIELLPAAGIKVVVGQEVWGSDLDNLIARAKVVLNTHFYPSGIFEIARCSYLFANSKAVISEDSEDAASYEYMGEGIFWSANMAKSCRAMLADEFLRKETERKAFNNFSRMDESAILQSALCGMKERVNA